VATDRVDAAPGVVGIGDATGQPAVAEAPDAAQRGLGVAADPDRQRAALRRLGLHGHRHRAVGLAGEVHARLAPVGPQQLDRLVHAGAARVEILAHRLVLGFLPADADTQAHAATGERVERA